MTPETFIRWLQEMKTREIIRFDKEAAALLDVTQNGIIHMKKHGADRRTALACAALLNRLEPYGTEVCDDPAKAERERIKALILEHEGPYVHELIWAIDQLEP